MPAEETIQCGDCSHAKSEKPCLVFMSNFLILAGSSVTYVKGADITGIMGTSGEVYNVVIRLTACNACKCLTGKVVGFCLHRQGAGNDVG